MSRVTIDKTLSKLAKSIEEGNYYEAHQMYRTVYNRLRSQQNWVDCKKLTLQGAEKLLKNSQATSALDLLVLWIETLSLSNSPVNDEEVRPGLVLLELFPVPSKERNDFLSALIKWTSKSGASNTGDPLLHHLLGEAVLADDSALAERHLLLGNIESARLLANAHSASSPETIARIALKFLCTAKFQCCKAFMAEVIKSTHLVDLERVTVDGLSVKVFSDARLNFVQLLLLTIEHSSKQKFLDLRQHYSILLQRDAEMEKMVTEIAQVYFGLRIGGTGVNLGDLLSSLLRPAAPSTTVHAASPAPQISELD